MTAQPCEICGDPEPVHVHDNAHDMARIEDYFTVGRGEDEMQAANRWKTRALRAEVGVNDAREWLASRAAAPEVQGRLEAILDQRRTLSAPKDGAKK